MIGAARGARTTGETQMKVHLNARSLTLGALALSALALGSYTTKSSAQDLEKVTFGLNWLPHAGQCGFFQARDDGTYKEYGLDVELIPGGPGMSMPQLTAAGTYDLAMGSALTTLAMRNNGIPGVTVAAMMQKTPSSFVAHPDSGIKTLEDFKGKPIMISNIARPLQWQWAKKKYGFDDSQLRPYVYNPAAFVADKELSTQGYATEDGYLIGKALGAEPVIVLLADYGFPDYSTAIFTMQETIEKRPEMVKKFVEASIKGFTKCVYGDPVEAINAIAGSSDQADRELVLFSLEKMRSYDILTSGDAIEHGIGAMTDERWKEIFETMADIELYPKDMDFKPAYTLQFTNLGIGKPSDN
jgi:NitT/TauT family transport system substrate-binding protein